MPLYKVFYLPFLLLDILHLPIPHCGQAMKKVSWIRKNWLLVAGLSFIGVHLGTYLIQKAAKSSAKSGLEIKSKDVDE